MAAYHGCLRWALDGSIGIEERRSMRPSLALKFRWPIRVGFVRPGARVWKSMVKAGLALDRAAALSGLMAADDDN